ncbi:MAG: hypothetical protein DLM60_12230 [Pseudonocardiales bacterium]|nr:MAG: hypothetical protein DLM60_12230 [Pseudonocardiales bacterium]
MEFGVDFRGLSPIVTTVILIDVVAALAGVRSAPSTDRGAGQGGE